ncbi:hypothetical protein CEK62_09320 [Alcanivorax sp. N3-2A]|nr:hypothetical protein CEK62_09320 [Alcanivorax sp. N3-2A]
MIRRIGYGLLLACLVLSGCGGGGGSSHHSSEGGAGDAKENTIPVAEAGRAQNVKVGATVALDGSASHDENGDTLTYHWQLTSQPDASNTTLEKANTPKPRFVADAVGEYVAELVVNDGQADSQPASITVTATQQNSAPVAIAGPDQSVATGNSVTLDGRDSSDADQDTLTYRWSIAAKPTGSAAELQGADTVSPTFTADLDGEYRLALIVNDGVVDSTTDEVIVTASTANSAPVAKAGADKNVTEGDTVTLDGSQSLDADDDTLSYQWHFVSRPDGSNATLSGEDTATPSFNADVAGDFVVALVVNDGQQDSDADNVAITAAQANSAPVAAAGTDQAVKAGDTVTLDGSGSQDADGDLLSYQWQFVSRPDGSQASLSDSSAVAPTFVADLPGAYVVSLTVNDGEADSTSARITITATEVNAAPTADAGADQAVTTSGTVTLDGSNSKDANSDTLTYQWRFVSRPDGSAATLTDADSVAPSFVADLAGSYVLELTVDDGTDQSTPDRITVTATDANVAPVADAGGDQSIVEGATLTLDGSNSRDADGDLLSYQWQFVSKPTGSAAELSDDAVVAPSFVADVAGSFVLELTVSDGSLSSSDRTTVTAVQANVPPVANAGEDQNIATGSLVVLDGGDSADADGDSLSFQWQFVSVPTDSIASLVNATSDSPSFTADLDGAYVLELIVNDGEDASAADRVTVTAETLNSKPVAHAGADASAYVGQTHTFDGSGSTDADNDALTYQWTLKSRPTSSKAVLNDTTSASPSLTVDVAGDYVAELVVNDGQDDSAPVTVVLSAVAPKLGMEREEEDFFSGDKVWKYVGLSYSSNADMSRTFTGTTIPPMVVLDTFRLEAEGQDYTIVNVQVNGAPSLNPQFVGLVSGQVIHSGDTVEFAVVVDNLVVTRQAVQFSFNVQESGKSFQSNYTVTLR